mgnify:CR=1 FL=1
MQYLLIHDEPHLHWNKGKLTGQKSPLRRSKIRAIRLGLQLRGKVRDLALFNLAIDSKLRACDLVSLRVSDVLQGGTVANRAIIMQQKTKRPVQFEITEQTQLAIQRQIESLTLSSKDYLFPSRINRNRYLTTRQYAKLLKD